MKPIKNFDLLSPPELDQYTVQDQLKIGASVRFKNFAMGLMFVAIGIAAIRIAW